MKDLPRITVITPCFNQARYLERSICSVLDQGYDALEFVVVDGGSCDGSREILRHYENELAWWTCEEDEGPADAINRALAHTSGDVIAYHQADDLYTPFALWRVAERMSGRLAPPWLVGGCDTINEADRPIERDVLRDPLAAADDLHGRGCTSRQPARFFRRELFERFGAFETMLHHRFDLEFHCRLIAAGIQPAVLPETLALHRLHRESMSGLDPLSSRQEHADVLDRYAQPPHRITPQLARIAA